jgi:peptidoglycan/LPS O-acetylase OafA/YrhL
LSIGINKSEQFETVPISNENNFDLIRLSAAVQVAISHGATHLNVKLPAILEVIEFFPGVPVFFTVSGFLIANSYYRNQNLKRYSFNRALRIFPGLWTCFIFTTILLLSFGILKLESFANIEFWKWFFTQITIFQFYTPDILRGWGTGTPNGSLWTIPIEIQFYILLPLIVMLINRSKTNRIVTITLIGLVALFSNYFYSTLEQETVFAKLFHVSIFPFLMYFMFGFFLYLLWPKIKLFIVNKGMLWLVIYALYVFIFYFLTKSYSPSYYPDVLGWISYLILSIMTLSLSFSYQFATKKLLRGNDISYGIYIYHMVIINAVLELDIREYSLIIAMSITFILAYLSWVFVEKPFLRLKNKFMVNSINT